MPIRDFCAWVDRLRRRCDKTRISGLAKKAWRLGTVLRIEPLFSLFDVWGPSGYNVTKLVPAVELR